MFTVIIKIVNKLITELFFGNSDKSFDDMALI